MRAQINCKIDPFTISGSVLRTTPPPPPCTPNHALLHYVFRGQGAPSGTLMSRKRNQFISISVYILVYQPCSFACILVIFLTDKVSSRSYVRKLTALSLAFLCLFYVYFTVFWDRRSLQIRYAVFFQHGFKC